MVRNEAILSLPGPGKSEQLQSDFHDSTHGSCFHGGPSEFEQLIEDPQRATSALDEAIQAIEIVESAYHCAHKPGRVGSPRMTAPLTPDRYGTAEVEGVVLGGHSLWRR